MTLKFIIRKESDKKLFVVKDRDGEEVYLNWQQLRELGLNEACGFESFLLSEDFELYARDGCGNVAKIDSEKYDFVIEFYV